MRPPLAALLVTLMVPLTTLVIASLRAMRARSSFTAMFIG